MYLSKFSLDSSFHFPANRAAAIVVFFQKVRKMLFKDLKTPRREQRSWINTPDQLLVISRRLRSEGTCTREPRPPRHQLPLLLAQLCRCWPSCCRARQNNCRCYWILGCAPVRATTSVGRPCTCTPPVDWVADYPWIVIPCRKLSPNKVLSVRVAASVSSHCAGICIYSLAYQWIVDNDVELVPVSWMNTIVGLRLQ